MEVRQEIWQNMNGKIFHTSIIQLVEEAIIREQAYGYRLKVCVGSDSHVYGDTISYATAVVFIREGKGRSLLSESKKKYKRSALRKGC